MQLNDRRFERAPDARRYSRLLWGAPVDGRHRTNATWAHRGDRAVYVLDGLRPPSRWSYLPLLARAGIVWGLIATCLLAGWAWSGGHTAVLAGLAWALRLVAFVPAVLVGWHLAERLRTWRLHRDVIRPLHLVIHQLTGRPEVSSARSYIHLPPDWAEPDGPPIVVDLPHTFVADDTTDEHLRAAAGVKLGVEVATSWRLGGRDHTVAIRPAGQPPRLVAFADRKVARLVEDRPEPEYLLGVASGRRAMTCNLDDDAPHVLVSCASGGGKTSILRAVLAQALHDGALASVLDYKRFKFNWAKGIPGLDIARDVAEMHDVLLALDAEVVRRIHVLEQLGEEPDEPPFPRHLLIVDEGNTTTDLLRAHWRQIKPRGVTGDSPAIAALERLVMLGREMRVHVVSVFQHSNARAVGSGAAREQYSCRVLGRWSPQLWKMMAGDVGNPPPKSQHPGRVAIVMGGEATITQALLMTPEEAKAWATSGSRPVDHPGTPALLSARTAVPHILGPDYQGEPGLSDARRPALYAVPEPDDESVTLVEAVAAGIVGPTLAAVRSARDKDPEFPQPVGKRGRDYLYPTDQLATWRRNRPRAGRGEPA